MDTIFDLSYQLHDLIIKSEKYLTLKEKEKIIYDDNNLVLMLNKLADLQELYLKEKTKKNLKCIHDLKLEIDLNDKIKEYKKAYKNLMILLDDITSTSFKDIINDNLLIDMVKRI